jgi:alcohol dehydrogenase (cytochrome c)
MNWYFQYTPNDHWDYDESHTHILIDGQVAGQPRKLITHSARNGFLYTFERSNGQTLLAKPYIEKIHWTAGIDQKTGRPLDYDPSKDIQTYNGKMNQTLTEPTKRLCPSMSGGNNYWPASYSQRTKLIYIPSNASCNEVTLDPKLSNKAGDWKGATFRNIERVETDIILADPFTGEVKKQIRNPYPNVSGALTTGGGLMFTGYTDGTFVAYDDTTLDQVWKINLGTGFNAPPMTFEVNGKQYIAILSGLSPISKRRHSHTPELREMRHQTMLFVFGL